jgi:hypothetical protein
MHSQEITLGPVDEGWLIEIFSWRDNGDCPTWCILIPRNGGRPVVSNKWPPDIVDMLGALAEEP